MKPDSNKKWRTKQSEKDCSNNHSGGECRFTGGMFQLIINVVNEHG